MLCAIFTRFAFPAQLRHIQASPNRLGSDDLFAHTFRCCTMSPRNSVKESKMAGIKACRVIAFSVALGLSLAVANAETPEQIQALDREWAQACVQSDIAKLEQILSDDLTYTHSSGQTQS